VVDRPAEALGELAVVEILAVFMGIAMPRPRRGYSARPIPERKPDLARHGRAHAGTFEGAIGKVPGL
jgi:hypothetical protein